MGPRANPVRSVERFFQIAFLGMLTAAFGALADTGRLDVFTFLALLFALLTRTLTLAGYIRRTLSGRTISLLGLSAILIWIADYFAVSQEYFRATIHSAALLAAVRIATARSNRTLAFSGIIAFLGLLGAAVLAEGPGYFFWLTLFLVCTVAVLSSGEIRRGFQHNEFVVHSPGSNLTRRLAWVTLTATLSLMIIGAGLFLISPRTARLAGRLFPHRARLSGFSTSIDLGRFGAIAKDTRPVMHIRSFSGPLPTNILWRGTALTDFDGKHWTQMSVPVMEVNPRRTVMVADRQQRSRLDGARMLYRVDIDSSDTGILFIAGVPEFINIDTPRLRRLWEDTYRALPIQGQPLRYEISAWAGTPLPYNMRDEERRRNLRLPPIDPRVFRLALQWAGEGTPLQKVARIEQHLKSEFRYSLDTTNNPPDDPLSDFLFNTRRGYCEYFASSMAVMVRSLGIPARVATGFGGGYYNPLSGLYVVRGAEAHAWVEAWIEGEGWRTWDPTPPAPPAPQSALAARLGMWMDAADSLWQQWVVTYDLGRQAEIIVRVAGRFRSWNTSDGGFFASLPTFTREWSTPQFAGWSLAAVGLALLIPFGLLPAWRWWKRRALIQRSRSSGGSRRDATELYLALLERLAARGFTKQESATPMEFALRLPDDQAQRVVQFTRVYNRARFGGEPNATAELADLLAAFGK